MRQAGEPRDDTPAFERLQSNVPSEPSWTDTAPGFPATANSPKTSEAAHATRSSHRQPRISAPAGVSAMKQARSLTQAAAIRLGGRMVKIAASVIAFGLASRSLGIDAFGTFAVVFAYIQMFNTIANFGLDRILIREVAQPERFPGAHARYTHASVTSRLFIAIVISCLSALIAVIVGFPADQITAILVFLPFIVVTAFSTNGVFGSVLQARNDNNSIALASVVSAVVVMGGTVAAVVLRANVLVFLTIYTLASLVDTLICAVASQRFVRLGMSWSWPHIRYMLSESLPLAIGSTFVLIYGRIDIILLDKLTDPATHQVALYGVAYKFFDVLSTISATVMIVLFPGLARARAESRASGQRLYSQVFTLMAAIGLPLTFSILVFRDILLNLLVGHGYLDAQAALPGLMLAMALIFPSAVASYMLIVNREQRWNLPMAIIAAVLNIGLNLLLIPRYGYVASAWVTAATEGFVIVFNVTAVALTSRMLPSLRNVFLIIVACAPFALVLLPGKLSYVGGVAGIVLFGVLLLVFGVVRPAQLRALVSSRASRVAPATGADGRAHQTDEADETISDVLPALNYVAQSDQPSAQLPALRARRARTPNWEDSTHMRVVRPDEVREPPERIKRRQVAAYIEAAAALAVMAAACVAFLPRGVEIAAALVFAVIVGLVVIRPHLALFVFVLLLPLHNFLMALLYHATGDATFIKIIQPWKEVVLAVALLRVGIPALLAWLRTRRLRLGMLDVLVLLFMGICLVGVAIPSDAVSLVGRMLGFRQLALPFAVYFLGRLAVPTRRELRWLVGLFAALALLNAAGAIGERLFWGGNLFAAIDFGGYNAAFFGFKSDLPYNMGTTFFTGTPGWLPRAGSFVMNPLDLATLMTISLPIVLAALPFFTAYWRWPGRVLLSTAALLGSVAITLAFSRTNLVAFLVEVALLVFVIGIRRQWAGALLAGLGYLIGLSWFEQTTVYVSGVQEPSARVSRALQGMLSSGSYTALDVVVPTITLIAMASVVAATIGVVQAMRQRQHRSLAVRGVLGILAVAVLASCLLAPPLVEANKTGILAPLVGGISPFADAASGDNSSTLGHLESYKRMVPFIIHHPLGYGIGSAGFVGVRQGTGLGTESAYLPVGAQLGFPGLLVYLAIFLAILFALWNVTRARLDRLSRAVFVGALAAWIFVLIDGILTEVTLNFFAFYVMLWLTGSAVSLTRLARVTWNDAHQRYQAVRPLRVAMDVQCLYTARTGVRTYVTMLLEEFARGDLPHAIVPISGPKGLPRTNVVFRVVDQVLNLVWLHLLLPLRLLLGGYDVLFSPEYLTPVWCPVPNAVTYHDSAFLRRPQDYNRLWHLFFRRVNLPALRRADAIIVPSRFAMNEAVRYAKFSPDKVCVTHLGGPQPGSMRVSDEIASGCLRRFGLERGSYFLHVGVLERRKNLPMLIEAFHQLTLRGLAEPFKLVLAGQPGPRPDLNDAPNIRATIERLGLQDRVVLTGYLSRDDVDALLMNAFAYVLPSRSEGFGIPVLEAFAAGIPVVCSTAGALPEVSGDAALHFDPENGAQLMECLIQLGSDPGLQRDLVRAGTERARQFTWEQTARETLAAFEAAVLHASAPSAPPLSLESDGRRP